MRIRIHVAIAVSTLLLSGVSLRAQPFPATASYDYDLGSWDGAHFEVELTETGFEIPSIAGLDTLIVELDLVRTRGEVPEVHARAGGRSTFQVFEKGARGRRYLDLSALVGAVDEGDRVELTSNGAVWTEGPTTLHAFDNPSLEDRRVLVVAPHPDDAEIAAFGVYRTSQADVVTVTAGDAGGDNFRALYRDDGEHYRVKGWIRAWNSITVPFYGGVPPGRARNLGFYDATLEALSDRRPETVEPPLADLPEPGWYRSFNVDPVVRDRPFRSSWPGLVDDLLAELTRVEPESIVAPHPMLDRHRDHQFAAIALFEALERWSGEAELLLYTNHAIGNEAFPLGPRAAMSGLPPWNDGDLHASRIYSHPLSEDDRRLKLIALEAMHDLRPFDLREAPTPKMGRKAHAERHRYDYFRRAPRPNEIFFVVEPGDIEALRRDFLEARAADGELADDYVRDEACGTR